MKKNIIFWKNLNLIVNFAGLLEFVNYQIIQLQLLEFHMILKFFQTMTIINIIQVK